MTIYLYIKTHNITGLKYFGKTTKDYKKYTGSGKYWLNHLKKHGKDISTELYFSSNDEKEIEDMAINFSKSNNIVESSEWANLKYENGLDGGTQSEWITEETKKKMSKNRKGKPSWTGLSHSQETKKKMSQKAKIRCERDGPPKGAFKKGNETWNKGIPISEKQKEKFRDTLNKNKLTCKVCGKTTTKGAHTRFHGDKCKMVKNDKF